MTFYLTFDVCIWLDDNIKCKKKLLSSCWIITSKLNFHTIIWAEDKADITIWLDDKKISEKRLGIIWLDDNITLKDLCHQVDG
jgi:hypothetical protein